MEDLPGRVTVLTDKVNVHHQVLFGPEDCPETGLVRQFNEIKALVTKQVFYNKIMTVIASTVMTTAVGYLVSLFFK